MKKKIVALCIGMAFLGMASMAPASLVTIGTATYGGSDYKLIWDDNNNGNSVVWLDYSNAIANWSSQNAWAAGLDGNLTYKIDAAYTVIWDGDWRLGSTVDGVWQYGADGTTTAGYNITSSDMGHLFYEELGNLGYKDTAGNNQAGFGLQNTGVFDNLIASWYWSGTEYAANTSYTSAWYFDFAYGSQNFKDQDLHGYGLALHSVQVSAANPVPVPSTIFLLSTGLAGLAGYRRKRKGMSC